MNINIDPFVEVILISALVITSIFRYMEKSNLFAYLGTSGIVAIGVIVWMFSIGDNSFIFYLTGVLISTITSLVAALFVHFIYYFGFKRPNKN